MSSPITEYNNETQISVEGNPLRGWLKEFFHVCYIPHFLICLIANIIDNEKFQQKPLHLQKCYQCLFQKKI